MNIKEQIKTYIDSQPDPKRADIEALHARILKVLPKCKLWFLDGKDDKGKIVSNPNIGYGLQTIKYADGTTREFYQIGLSANKTPACCSNHSRTRPAFITASQFESILARLGGFCNGALTFQIGVLYFRWMTESFCSTRSLVWLIFPYP